VLVELQAVLLASLTSEGHKSPVPEQYSEGSQFPVESMEARQTVVDGDFESAGQAEELPEQIS